MLKTNHLTSLLISDFNIDPLVHFLENSLGEPSLKCEIAPIDQVKQVLQDHTRDCWKKTPEITVIWSQPYQQIPSYAQFLCDTTFNYESIKKEVSEFSNYIRMAASISDIVFVPSWTLPSYYRGQGILDYKNSMGHYNTLMRMNLQLIDELEDCENIYILNTQQWISSVKEAEDERMWYLGRILFSRDLFREAANELKAGIQTIYGKTRKLLILDLDDTLWGGVIGDLGIDGIRLGGIDPVGQAFLDFQKHILTLKNRGILLAIASKNDEKTALEVFEKHLEMILKKEDFVTWRINWEDKAQNIVDMVTELNLGLQSVVFIDDNPVERTRVKEALPEVYVPDWPEDPIFYKKTLLQLRCFDKISIGEEDKNRTFFYQDDKKRKEMIKTALSLEDWLHTLNIKVTCEELSSHNLTRAVQLLNRVNQFNLITRRMDKTKFLEFIQKEEKKAWVFYASDRIGDYGMIGLTSFEIKNHHLKICDFLLSCRAMGRGIEKTMLYLLVSYGKANNLQKIIARFNSTAKNAPCEKFLHENGFKPTEEGFELKNFDSIHLPSYIQPEIKNFELENFVSTLPSYIQAEVKSSESENFNSKN